MPWRRDGAPPTVAPAQYAGHPMTSPLDAGPSNDHVLAIALILALSAFALMIVWLVAR